MQYFSYNISADIIELAESYFPLEYVVEIRKKHTYRQSLAGRYMVSKIVENEWGVPGFSPKIDAEGRPISEGGFYWSLSHSEDHVFVGVSTNPIGVDIEVIHPRDISLFSSFNEQEWDILGGKNWESFYILWSAKEALVKKYLGGVDEIGKWQLITVETVSNKKKRLSFSDGITTEMVTSEIKEKIVLSICV